MSERIRELSSRARPRPEDTLAARGHARRRPGLRPRAPHRGAPDAGRAGDVDGRPACGCRSTATRCCRRSSSGRAAGRRIRRPRCITLRLARAGARAQLDLVWSGTAMSTETVASWEIDPITVGDEDAPADGARRRRAPRRRVLVRARARAPRGVLPLPAAARGRGRALEAAQVVRGDSRPEYYDFDLFQTVRAGARARRPAAGRAELHGVRHRDHRARSVGRRRDHPDRRDPHRQRQAAPRTRASSSWSTRGGRFPTASMPIHGIRRRWSPASPPSRPCCRRSTPSRRTPCWSGTTPRSTCASCS